MGLFEPLKRLPELFKIRKSLLQHYNQHPPDIFIGVDAPDFNLGIEKKLRKQGIKTVHYVSPTIWAWRASRIKTIQKAVDLMLTIFPFENKIYDAQGIPNHFIGHPFADEIPIEIDSVSAKKALHFTEKEKVVAVLPGSRDKELYYLAEKYIETMQWCFEKDKTLQFIIPLVSEKHEKTMQALLKGKNLPVKMVVNQTRLALSACDVALVTSGTATLEVMLHKKPMVVGYRMNPLTYQIAKRLVKVSYIAMANLLAEEKLAPEFIQGAVEPKTMGTTLLDLLNNSERRTKIINRYTELHRLMRKNASQTAAAVILKQLN